MRNVGQLVTKFDASDPDKPDGAFKNDVVAGDKTGTEYNKDWPDDLLQAQYSLLRESWDLPQNTEEFPGQSQVVTAIKKIYNRAAALDLMEVVSQEEAYAAARGFDDNVSTGFLDSVTVVCGSAGYMLYSHDGIAWTDVTITTLDDFYCVAFSDTLGLFVAMGEGGLHYQSTDGKFWSSGAGIGAATVYGIVWDTVNSQFVACRASGQIMTSTNGAVWTSRTSGVSGDLYDIAAGSKGVYVVGDTGSGGPAFLYSIDGVTWVQRTLPGAWPGYIESVAVKKDDVNPSTGALRDLVAFVAENTTNRMYTLDTGLNFSFFSPEIILNTNFLVSTFIDYLEETGSFYVGTYHSTVALCRGIFTIKNPLDSNEQWRRLRLSIGTGTHIFGKNSFVVNAGRDVGHLLTSSVVDLRLWHSNHFT